MLRVPLPFATTALIGLLAWSTFAPVALAQSQNSSVGYAAEHVKAAFLYRLPTFIRWSDGRSATHFCFDESSVVFETFRRLIRAKNGNTTATLVTPGQDDQACDVLYTQRLPIAAISSNQLLVSDLSNFAIEGGMVELTRRGSRLSMNINVESLETGNLSASSQLLKLANIVRTD